jgi:hypothetical protein
MLFSRIIVSFPWKIYIILCVKSILSNKYAYCSSLILNGRRLLKFPQTKEDLERKAFVVFSLSPQMNKNILSTVEDVLVSSRRVLYVSQQL